MADLPKDIIGEILLRLPVKSLMRFRSVCKQWLSLINDPEFTKLQLTRATNSKNYFEYRRLLIQGVDSIYTMANNDEAVDIGFSFIHGRLVGCCNGLVCFTTWNFETFYLLNPSTREHKELAGPEGFPTATFVFYGFGYVSSTDDYKLIIGEYVLPKSTVKIYSLKSNSWKTIKESPVHCCFQLSGVLCNGALHWAADTRYDNNRKPLGRGMVAFDLKEEKFREVALPDDDSGTYLDLAVLGGELSMTQHGQDDRRQIWLMKEYGVKNSWMEVRLPPSPLIKFNYTVVPFEYTKEGEIVVLISHMRLAVYNSRREHLQNITLGVPEGNYWYITVSYVETLISPNAYNRNEEEGS